MLRQFNVFRVLRFEHGEIRHSNMLAWLLQPDETHKLGDSFLRGWLLRVVNDAAPDLLGGLTAESIKAGKIGDVEIAREWNFLDLLVKVTTTEGDAWVIAIENKWWAKQGKNQLAGYRRKVESAFPTARRMFVFLTAKDESPDDEAWVTAKHRQVYEVLSTCLKQRATKRGREAVMLMRHYLTILEERCMENPKITELARKIYERHRRALDVIIEHRTEPIQLLTDALGKCIQSSARRSGVIPMATENGYARLLPLSWNTKANRAGHEWGATDSAFVLIEIGIRWGSQPWFEVIASKSPNKNWRRELYEISQQNELPIGRWDKGTTDDWMRIYSVKCPIKIDRENLRDVDGKAMEIWIWCSEALKKPDFQKVIRLVAAHLKKLPQPKFRNEV
ncbi:MAG: PD-(D/E)XK nuclease family protein [Limisphaerales bacterium]